MEKKYVELHSLYAEVERDIARLKIELKQSETRKKILQEKAKYHVAKICPDYYKKIFSEDAKNLLDPNKNDLEKMFADQDSICKNILGYSFTVGECLYEEVGNILLKNWEVHGEVGENTFIIQFVSDIPLDEISTDNENFQNIKLKSLEIFPHSDIFDGLASKMMELDHDLGLRALIPCLYTYQRLQRERDSVEEKLSAYRDITLTDENETLVIAVNIDSFELSIEWDICFIARGYNFFNVISVKVEELEARRRFEDHPELPYLLGEEPLLNGNDVIRLLAAIMELE